jgi:hypothetical protein
MPLLWTISLFKHHLCLASGFSETDTQKCDCIHLLWMKALQFGLKKTWLNFMAVWVVMEANMMDIEEEVVDLLGSLFEGDKEAAFDMLIAAMGEGDEGDNM